MGETTWSQLDSLLSNEHLLWGEIKDEEEANSRAKGMAFSLLPWMPLTVVCGMNRIGLPDIHWVCLQSVSEFPDPKETRELE